MSRRSSEAAESRRNSRVKGGSSADGIEWRGYIDISLNAEQKDAVRRLADSDPVDLLMYIGLLLEDGLKLSFRWDQKNNCFIAAATGHLAGDPNAGWTLTGRGGDWTRALCALYYRHAIICERGVWANFAEKAFAPDDIG